MYTGKVIMNIEKPLPVIEYVLINKCYSSVKSLINMGNNARVRFFVGVVI